MTLYEYRPEAPAPFCGCVGCEVHTVVALGQGGRSTPICLNRVAQGLDAGTGILVNPEEAAKAYKADDGEALGKVLAAHAGERQRKLAKALASLPQDDDDRPWLSEVRMT